MPGVGGQQGPPLQQGVAAAASPVVGAQPILIPQGNGGAVLVQNISQYPPSPPVFVEIFKNSRFALGDNALFEGRISGWPRPTVTWLRKNLPLPCNIQIIFVTFIWGN
jgi:hypothetical protein